MASIGLSCIKCVDVKNSMVKNGRTASGKQRYICRNCKRTRVQGYTYRAYHPCINKQIIILTKEGLGIRSTARVLGISTTTLLKRIVAIARNIPRPPISKGKVYEVDEIRTFIRRKDKPIWIVYALERTTGAVANFWVGPRTNRTLGAVLKTLKLAEAKRIFTDGLKNYKYLIGKAAHRVKQYGTNRIERNNLTLRTHLKRLSRRTICFSRSLVVLSAVLRIYFWG